MKRTVLVLLGLNVFIMMFGLVYAITYDVNALHQVIREVQQAVNSANNYCVNQVQDIEGMQEKLSSNHRSRAEYQAWLSAMQGMKQFSIDEHGQITTNATRAPRDPIFSNRYLPKLISESSSTGNILTPLSFGITYLDRQQLEQDALWYMRERIMAFNDRWKIGTFGLHRIDPMTLDVRVALTATPLNLKNTTNDSAVNEQYLRLFGATPPDYSEMTSSGVTSSSSKVMSDVIVQYDITYYVYYDFIPSSLFFRTNTRELLEHSVQLSGNTPPAHLYFPMWYDSDGNINPDKEMRTAMPVFKLIPSEYTEFTYSYILTN